MTFHISSHGCYKDNQMEKKILIPNACYIKKKKRHTSYCFGIRAHDIAHRLISDPVLCIKWVIKAGNKYFRGWLALCWSDLQQNNKNRTLTLWKLTKIWSLEYSTVNQSASQTVASRTELKSSWLQIGLMSKFCYWHLVCLNHRMSPSFHSWES